MRKFAFAILAAALAVPALAAPASAADAPKPEKEKKICKRGADTGSHMVQRICKTASEWASAEQDRAKVDTVNHPQ